MKANGILALLTDFGNCDWYVASMKGAALTANRDVRLMDITHEINPGSISEGAFVLSRCFNDFPKGTTFVVVVDPGVGTSRKPLIVETQDYGFVGPDNGVLYPVISQSTVTRQIRINNPAWLGIKSSATFHGRDIFAPAGSRMASGAAIREAGSPVEEVVPFLFPQPQFIKDRVTGQFLYFDRFGNGLTNLMPAHVDAENLAGLRIGETVFPLATTFGEMEVGEPLCYWGSSGFLEVAIRDGNAKKAFGISETTMTEPVYLS